MSRDWAIFLSNIFFLFQYNKGFQPSIIARIEILQEENLIYFNLPKHIMLWATTDHKCHKFAIFKH